VFEVHVHSQNLPHTKKVQLLHSFPRVFASVSQHLTFCFDICMRLVMSRVDDVIEDEFVFYFCGFRQVQNCREDFSLLILYRFC
jgi:hypothetical protein